MQAIYRFWVTIMTAAVVLQIAFAGFGSFTAADKAENGAKTVTKSQWEDAFGPHGALGTLIVISGLVLLLLSFGARGRRRIQMSAAAFVLLVIQLVLGWTGASAPYILGALHPINAFIILGLLGSIARIEWMSARMRQAEPAAAPTS